MATLELLSRLDGHQDFITKACMLRNEDGVLSISEDKTIRLWLKRDTGNYWPSVCHILPSPATCMHFDLDSRRLFVGLDNGTISEFIISEDYNRINHQRFYPSHQGKVTALVFSPSCRWLLSAGLDKHFHWYCSDSAYRLGTYQCTAPCTSLQFDELSRHVFVGDKNGQITMLELIQSSYKLIKTLAGYQTSIRSLEWDPSSQMLFSTGSDNVILCWDIGGRKGITYELQGHTAQVTSLCYSKQSHTLVSGGDDCRIIAWNMKASRTETPAWIESDNCQKCQKPFFWNFKVMFDQKTLGIRQHHCRNCGKAVCNDCSLHRTTIPPKGFEHEVRVCDECRPQFSDLQLAPLASFYSAKHLIACMDLDESKKVLLTTGPDRSIKLWDASPILDGSGADCDGNRFSPTCSLVVHNN